MGAGFELVGFITGTETIATGAGVRVRWRKMKAPAKPFALCIDNTGYRVSLILGKVYLILPDPAAAKDDLVRIVDESEEDYLYHKGHFAFVDFPSAVRKKILALQGVA